MIGRGMDRWMFSSSSLIFRVKKIIDWWKLGKEGFPFIFIGQGMEVFGEKFGSWFWKGTYDLERSFGNKEVLD